MNSFERLIGPKPSPKFLAKSRAQLDAMFKRRVEQQRAQAKDQRAINNLSFAALHNVIGEDPKAARATKLAKGLSAARAKKRAVWPPRPPQVEQGVRLGSISATFAPPYWGTWSTSWDQTGSGQGGASANKNGSFSMSAWSGNNSGTLAVAAALGGYFQPPADEGILNISAGPSLGYDLQTWYVFDSANAGGFIGLYVGEYTLKGEFVSAPVDQQISIAGLGGASSIPLFASMWADSDHFYEIWVWGGVNAEGDGWSAFWGSAAYAELNSWVPSISIFYYS